MASVKSLSVPCNRGLCKDQILVLVSFIAVMNITGGKSLKASPALCLVQSPS